MTENFKINLNQNLWGLIISISSLGVSEFFYLNTLYYFALILTTLTTISYIITLIFYTKNYCKNKK